MKRSTAVLLLLVALLIASNTWWAYNAIDAGVTAMYRDQVLEEQRQALIELLAVAPEAASAGATRESVLAVARAAADRTTDLEKEGFVWVGKLGYRFSEEGRLLEVRTAWSPL